MKCLIIGAGLTGLMLAQKLSPGRDLTVFDKARGVGGRLATRRADDSKFDHGAQFYRSKEPLQAMHERWLKKNLVKLWFTENGVKHFCARDGMTAIAKDLATDANVVLSERVVSLKRESTQWIVSFESGRSESADEVIFTCPVPQSLEILKTSGIAYLDQLSGVIYSKGLVLLIEKSPVPSQFSEHGYVEPENSLIFSIADQSEKGVSRSSALTVTLNAEFSERHFDAPESEVIGHVVFELKKLSPSFEAGETQLKKWRYCQVQKSFGDLYLKVTDGLYLAGDGFGGASLNGAARSAIALADHLLNQA